MKVLYNMMGVPLYVLFNIGAFGSLISILINFKFSESLDVDRLDNKGYIKWTETKKT